MKRPIFTVLIACLALSVTAQNKKQAVSDASVRDAVKRATGFMYDKVSNQGGFLWYYMPDMSKMWGELEAYPSMVWVDDPSTPAMGQLMLDAYHATGDEYYYDCAVRSANILIRGQLPCGGWGYKFDLAGASSEKRWFQTIGAEAWGSGEHNHFYGNATFDDNVTAGAITFLMRIYLEKSDPRFKPALDKAVDMLLESQFPFGGWPQRWPLMYDHPDRWDGSPDYSSFITLNDDVHDNNVELLMRCYFLLSDHRAYEPLLRAMNCLRLLQQGYPSAGWADQYDNRTLLPGKAREYEPPAISAPQTINSILRLIEYYKLTGDSKFLNGIPVAIEYLESIALDEKTIEVSGRTIGRGSILAPRFVVPGTTTPLYLHRKGTNIRNGRYYYDQDPTNTIQHYSSFAVVRIDAIKKAYDDALKITPQQAMQTSPLYANAEYKMPEYFSKWMKRTSAEAAGDIMASMNDDGSWIVPMPDAQYPPYIGPGSAESPVTPRYEDTLNDPYNTVSRMAGDPPHGISVRNYIENVSALISYLVKL